jgi:hypothetical protein
MDEYADTRHDAGLLAAQAVEHAKSPATARRRGLPESDVPQAVKLLDQTLAEEKNTDETLTRLRKPRSVTSSGVPAKGRRVWTGLGAAAAAEIFAHFWPAGAGRKCGKNLANMRVHEVARP